MNKVTRAERILQNLTDKGTLSENGREWLIAALDPMHDTLLPHLSGWPDVCDAASVVRCHKESLQISCPSDLNLAPWDCVINSLPILNDRNVALTTHINNALTWGTGGTSSPIAPICVTMYPSGAGYSLAPGNASRRLTVSLPQTILQGSGRLIGLGFETTNTTAELYKQGTCTAYRQPQHARLTQVLAFSGVNSVTYSSVPYGAQVMVTHPSSLKTAMSLAGSRQWPAAEGCYSVVPFLSSINPVAQPTYDQPLLISSFAGFNTDSAVVQGNGDWMANEFTTSGPSLSPVYPANSYAPIHSSGQIFSGLSPQSTLTLTVNFYYEYFPDSSDQALVSLATPSGGYDALALELYSRALHNLPVGVPAGMNGMGDWFAGIVSEFAPMIASAIGTVVPGFDIVGRGAKSVADSYLASQSPQSRPRPKQLQPRSSKKKQNNNVPRGKANGPRSEPEKRSKKRNNNNGNNNRR